MTDAEVLRGGLIVSVQAAPDSSLAPTEMIVALALAAQAGGAAAVRIEGTNNIRSVKAALRVPVIGLIKRGNTSFEPYITPTLDEAEAVAAAGADIIAFDATLRARPQGVTVKQLAERVRSAGALPMADCATESDAARASGDGVSLIATTLCGYTKETRGVSLPALDLIRAIRALDAFVICEGGVHSPADARAAREAGADAIVVGTAITNIAWVTTQFAEALRERTRTDATAVK